jgi:hypothetical protein
VRWRRKEEEEEEYEDEGGGGLIQVFLSVDNAAQLGTREEKHASLTWFASQGAARLGKSTPEQLYVL